MSELRVRFFRAAKFFNFWNTGASGRGNGRIWLPGLAGPSPVSGRALQPGPPRTELKEKSSPARAPGLRSRALNSVIGSNAVASAPEQREFRPSFGSDLTRNLSRLLDDAVARILFAQGNQQGLHLPAVVLDD